MVSTKKQQLVQELTTAVKENPVVGIVNMMNLPAQQLGNMRATLRARGVTLVMTRKKLIERALKTGGKEQLCEKMKGMPALLFSKDNPFALYSLLQKNKSPAPAKAGQESPKDIEVKAGPTSFAPGPIISELAGIGIKTKVDGGKLAILQDTIVAKEGEVISEKVAGLLKRLDIQPMEIGLDLVAVVEDGLVFSAKQLHVDEKEVAAQFAQAAVWARNLAVEAAYPTKDTISLLIQKAARAAKGLAVGQAIVTKDTITDLLGKAQRQAQGVKELEK